jgi:membrane-associated phospholipid phosphatase
MMTMRMQQRFFWLLSIFVLQSLYYPINQIMNGGIQPITLFDAYVPLWPIWVIPYLLWAPWWILSFFWTAWKMEYPLYYAFVNGAWVMMVGAFACYILLPTFVVRPSLPDTDLFSNLLRIIYTHDRSNNAFPSGHLYISSFIAFFWSHWYPPRRKLWWSIVAVIFLSTLFTHQHYLIDALGGIAFGWAGFRFGLWRLELLSSAPCDPSDSAVARGG